MEATTNRMGVPYEPKARAAWVGRTTCEVCARLFHRSAPQGPRHVCGACQ